MSQEKFTELFTHKVLSSLKKKELIDETVVENILSRTHSGFSVWAGDAVSPDDTDALLFLSRYIDRGPVAGNRITIADDIITYENERDEITHACLAVALAKAEVLSYLRSESTFLQFLWMKKLQKNMSQIYTMRLWNLILIV